MSDNSTGKGSIEISKALIGCIGAIGAAIISGVFLLVSTGVVQISLNTKDIPKAASPTIIDSPVQPTRIPVATAPPVTTAISPTSLPIPTLAQPTTPQLLNSIDRFKVATGIPKNRTQIYVNSGDSIYIEYLDGQWTGEKGKQPSTTGCGFYWDDPTNGNSRYPIDPRQNAGSALIGYIGNQPFLVGCKSLNSKATVSGELYLGMNDCQECYWDNEGEIFVRIAVTRK